MDDKELDAEIERLKRVSTSLRESMETLQKGLDGTKKSKEQLVKLGKAAEAQIKTYEDLGESLISLREQVKRTTNTQERAEKEEKLRRLEAQNARDKAEEGFRQGLGKMTGALLTGIANTFVGGVKAALSGSDGITVAAEFMKGGLDTANNAAQAGAGALKDFGAATAGAGGKIGKFGVAASIAGSAIGYLSNQMTELAKAGINFMITQTTKLMGDFVQLSQAGVVFSGGMLAMANTALNGGMTLDQFSKVVSANRAELTSLGMSMGDASKRMSGAMAAGGTAMRKGLFALGMTVEEQADTVAKTMAIMSGPAQRLKANDAEVAKQTEDYAKNLKLLAALTGEDMKAKSDAIRKENDTLAFQQKLDEMNEGQRLELQKAMEGMTESQRRALRENMIYGTVISKDIAISQATNSGVAKTNQEFAEAQRAGALSAEKARDIQAKNADETYKQAMGNKALAAAAMAGNQAASDAAKSQLSDAQYQRKLSAAATEEEKKKIEDEYKAGKEGKNTAAELMQINQDFAKEMQKIAVGALPAFADALKSVLNNVRASVLEAVKGAANSTGMPAWLAPLLGVATALLQLLPLLIKSKTAETVAGGAQAAKTAYAKTGSILADNALARGDTKGAARTVGIEAYNRAHIGSKGTTIAERHAEGRAAELKARKEFFDNQRAARAGAGTGAAPAGGKGVMGGGGGIGETLQSLAKGVSAFATPQAALGLGAVTLAIIGLAKAFEVASPGFEAFGKMVGEIIESTFTGLSTIIPPMADAIKQAVEAVGGVLTRVFEGIKLVIPPITTLITSVIKSMGETMGVIFNGIKDTVPPILNAIGDTFTKFGNAAVAIFKQVGETVTSVINSLTGSIIKLSNDTNPVRLLEVAGAITALGAAFIPFGIGGALAGLFTAGGGFSQIIKDLTAFGNLDPVKLAQVAEASKKLTDSLPSAAQMAAMAASGYVSKLTGGTPSGAGSNTPAATPAPSSSSSASTPSSANAANNNTAGGNDTLSVMKEMRDAARSQLTILERTVRAAEETLAVNKKILSATH
jgi:hypothetical protein